MNDLRDGEVCWFPVSGGCFKPASAIYKAGTKEMPVCSDHEVDMASALMFRRINLP